MWTEIIIIIIIGNVDSLSVLFKSIPFECELSVGRYINSLDEFLWTKVLESTKKTTKKTQRIYMRI